jgi:nitroreductase
VNAVGRGHPDQLDHGRRRRFPNGIDTIIARRFACREFSDRPVSRRMIEEILGIARFAPSGGNIQPWRVYVLAGRAKDRVSAALLTAHRESRNEHFSEYTYYTAQLPAPYLSKGGLMPRAAVEEFASFAGFDE